MHGEFLGTCRYFHGDRPIAGLQSRQSGYLLAYIFLHPNCTFTREQLAETVWHQDAIAVTDPNKRLRQELYRLNRAVAAAGVPLSNILTLHGNVIEAKTPISLSSDAQQFESCIQASLGIPARDLRDDHLARMELSASLYRGRLLPTLNAEWCIIQRERLQIMYLECIEKMALAYELRDNLDKALHYARLALCEDPLTESVHRIVMRCQYRRGNAPLAVRQFRKLSQTLRHELGPDIAPMPETMALLQQIKSGDT